MVGNRAGVGGKSVGPDAPSGADAPSTKPGLLRFTAANGKTYEADLSYTWDNGDGPIARAYLVKDGVVSNFSRNMKVSAIEAEASASSSGAKHEPKPKVSAAQVDYLQRFVDGPDYVFPFGVNGNTVQTAKAKGYVELVEGSTTQVRLTPAGREALGLEPLETPTEGGTDDTVPEAGGPDLAGPGGVGDPTPEFPGPVVEEGAGDGAGVPDYVRAFVSPGDKVYVHPQGSYIVASASGAVAKIGPDGKPRKTSATAAKLAVGHGQWTPVSMSKPAPVKQPVEPPLETKPIQDVPIEQSVVVAPEPEPELPSIPAPAASKFQVPMAFDQAPVADVPKYIEDPAYHFQQKVDGIRGQLVIEPGKKPWFRSKSGQQLVNSSAAKITGPLLAKLGAQSDYDGPRYTIDGELLDGKWYVFDVAVDGAEKTPWEDRMRTAEAWVSEMHKLGLKNIQALPVARTPEEKRKLWEAVSASGGEGVMMKRRDAPYNYGSRVKHTLKAKITSTADVVVMERNIDGKENARIGIHIGGKLVSIGTVSMQGKEKSAPVSVGDVIEVEYLWANPANHNLQQPRMVKRRPDKVPADSTAEQLRFVGKDVVPV